MKTYVKLKNLKKLTFPGLLGFCLSLALTLCYLAFSSLYASPQIELPSQKALSWKGEINPSELEPKEGELSEAEEYLAQLREEEKDIKGEKGPQVKDKQVVKTPPAKKTEKKKVEEKTSFLAHLEVSSERGNETALFNRDDSEEPGREIREGIDLEFFLSPDHSIQKKHRALEEIASSKEGQRLILQIIRQGKKDLVTLSLTYVKGTKGNYRFLTSLLKRDEYSHLRPFLLSKLAPINNYKKYSKLLSQCQNDNERLALAQSLLQGERDRLKQELMKKTGKKMESPEGKKQISALLQLL